MNGLPEGQGKYITESGDVYEGDFLGGQRHGQGILRMTDGKVIEGQWHQSVPHGSVKETLPDG